MGSGVNIPWVGWGRYAIYHRYSMGRDQYNMGRGRYTMGWKLDIPWIGVSICHR